MKSKTKFMLGMMISVVLIFASSVFVYKNIMDIVVRNEETTTQAFKEEQFNVIWSSLLNLQLQSEKEIFDLSSKIENSILALSNEQLIQMQYDMTNDIHNNDLHYILMKNIENQNLNNIKNHRNGIVVMSTKGYIEDFNYRRAQEISSERTALFREWQDSINNSYNKELEKDAISKLLNRTSGIIALESYDLTNNPEHIKIRELTYDSLLEVFLKEGMEGLRNYQIFVPHYITDFGDIFGNPDISQGIKVQNNKIIVVQEFNLYDQITANENKLANNDELKDLTARYNELKIWLYFFGLLLIIAVISLIFYFSTLYNHLIDCENLEECLCSQDDKFDEVIK